MDSDALFLTRFTAQLDNCVGIVGGVWSWTLDHDWDSDLFEVGSQVGSTLWPQLQHLPEPGQQHSKIPERLLLDPAYNGNPKIITKHDNSLRQDYKIYPKL